MSSAIRGQVLRSATQILRHGRDLASVCIDCRDTLAAAVCTKDALSLRIVDNPIGIISNPNLIDHRKCLEIEDGYRARVRGTDEAASKLPIGGHAMQPSLIRDFSDDGSGIQIKHYDLDAMRNIQAASFAIGRYVVPSGIAGNGNALHNAISAGC